MEPVRRRLAGALLGLYLLVPLAFGTSRPNLLKELLFVGLVAILVQGLTTLDEQIELRLSPLVVVLAANLLLWTVSLAGSSYPAAGWATLASRLAGVGLLLITPILLTRRREIEIAIILLLGAGSVMSLYALLQLWHLDPILHTEGLVGHFRVSSTTDHPTIFVTYLVACVPLNLAAHALFERRRRTRVLLGVSLLLCLAGAGASMSRMGWVAIITAAALTLWGMRRERRADGSPLSWIRLGLLVALATVVAGSLLHLAARRGFLDPGERERVTTLGTSFDKRLHIYRAALDMARQAPILGLGPGTFGLYFPSFRSAELARYYPDNRYAVEHAVSEPLEILTESGALGLLGWLVLLGLFWGIPLRARQRIADPGLRAVLVATAAGSFGVVMHGLAEVSLRFQPTQLVFWALPGLALAIRRLTGAEPRHRVICTLTRWYQRLPLVLGLGLAFGLALAVAIGGFWASTHLRRGELALAAGHAADAERALRRALAVQSGDLAARYRRAYALWQLGRLSEAEDEYREVARRSPYYFDVNHNLARVLFQQGRLEEAGRWVATAVRLNPYHVPSHDLAVQVVLQRGQIPQAERLARWIHRVAGHDPLAQAALARVRLAQGYRREARRLLELALRLKPGDKELRHLRRLAE